jgi:hypothetical protein
MSAELRLQGRREDLVADLEAVDGLADGFDIAGQFHAEDWLSWLAHPEREARRQPQQRRNGEAAHARVPDVDG